MHSPTLPATTKRQSQRQYSAIDTLADASLRTVEICVDHLSLKSPSSAPSTPLPPFKDVFYQRSWSASDALLSAVDASLLHDLPMPELALESVIQQKKAVGKKPTRRSLWKCQRRPLSMQDLLCAEPRQHYRARNERASHRRQCGVTDCYKYALSGGFCISHGGGKPCRQGGCITVAQSGGLCKAHGGGSKCKTAGCSSVARRKGFCMTHGGRQPCKIEGCGKCAHGGGLCIAHGGGKRCSSANCTKSAQAGGFCYSHGGGKRCSAPQCFQAARKGGRCIRHREDESASE